MVNDIINRQKLYNLVWTKSLTSITKEYSVTLEGIRNLCETMDVPFPNPDQKTRPLLSEEYNGPGFATLSKVERGGAQNKSNKNTTRNLKVSLKALPNYSIQNKLLQNARTNLKEQSKGRNHKYLLDTNRGILNIRVSIPMVDRALYFMDKLIWELEKQGYQLSVDQQGTFVMMSNERIEICLREVCKIVKGNEHQYFTDKTPTGLLAISYWAEWERRESRDNSKLLEDKIVEIINAMKKFAHGRHEFHLRCKRAAREREREEKIKEEKRRLKELEIKKVKQLFSTAKRWKKTVLLREYLIHIKAKKISENSMTQEFQKWSEWAWKKLEWYDPLINKRDRILNYEDRDAI